VRAGIFVFAAFFAPDALAWGLQTHVFLAQWLLAAAPFADPRIRAAALRLPRLVLAGACLPDLALAGRMSGVATFRRAHQWSTVRRIATESDEQCAIAIGYASHLLADVVAHNRFVPEHERRIVDVPHFTHALCEWAMDQHLKKGLRVAPAELLGSELRALAPVVAQTFGCREALARRTIRVLGCAERALRFSPLPWLSRRIVDLFDLEVVPRFDAYIGDASALVRRIEGVLQGAEPRWQPEPEPGAALAREAPAGG
jgi:hypothetical protein